MSDDPVNSSQTVEAAIAAATEVGGWTKHADGKCGFIIAADMVALGSIAMSGERLRLPVQAGDTLVIVSSLLLVLSAFCTLVALWPRKNTKATSLYDWPTLAEKSEPVKYPRTYDEQSAALWSHALSLACLNKVKYQWLKYSIIFAALGIPGAITWFLTLAPKPL